MHDRNRTYNSILNFIVGFMSYIISITFGFVVRAIFIKYLGESYLGANGLYSNILNMLSLAELGFSTAIVYSMYKPFAKKDFCKIAQLLILYKKIYTIVGWIILIFGLSIVPFMGMFIKDEPDIANLELYYILYLLNSVFSYWLFAYHRSILQADQKSYIISGYYSLFSIIKDVLQIFNLVIFKSYLSYLLVQITCQIMQNLAIRLKAKKDYPQIYNKNVSELPKKEKNKIFQDVKALMLNKFSNIILNCTDNIIISSIVGLKWVGLLSNYTLITEIVTSVLCQVTAAVQASLGNFFVKKEAEEGYKLFKLIDFLNFWLYGFSATALIVLLNPFITLWIGEKYTLNMTIIVILSSNFIISGILNTTWTFRSTLGLFSYGKYRPAIAALINIALSVLLGIKWGISGVLIATTISRLLLNVWYDPWVIHKYGFNKPIRKYYIYSCRRIFLLFGVIASTFILSRVLIFRSIITINNFIIGMFFTMLFPNIIFLLSFYKNDEFKHILNVIKFLTKRILNKLNLNR